MNSQKQSEKSNLPFVAALAAVLVGLVTACASSPSGDPEREKTQSAGQPEVWSDDDDPREFTDDLERKFSALPTSGDVTAIPWPGAYWPVYKDSINDRWDGDGTASPSKKYEMAFHLSGVEDAVSRYHGIDSRNEAATCTRSSQCDTKASEVCAKRLDSSSGRCIPTWFGLCQAWAAASILVPEPKHQVVKNGVTFKVQDIKALITLVHNSTAAKFVSLRCDADDRTGEITYDENGRPPSECRDTNAGTFHLLLANYVGTRKTSIIEDRSFDVEVWNQPIRAFKVATHQSLTAKQANQRIGVSPTGGADETDSGSLGVGEWSTALSVDVASGSSYLVRMSGTGDADLYVRFGSAPTASQYACRPYKSSSNEECHGTVPAGASKMFVRARGGNGNERAAYSLVARSGVLPSSYVLNPGASSLMYMKTDVSYVLASPRDLDGNLASRSDEFVRVERYEYVLELDRQGAVIGGEWVGESKHRHPDFIWLPTGRDGSTVAGGKITYDRVMDLAESSVSN